LFQAGAVAALLIATPVLYGAVVAMRRWWLVLVAAIIFAGASAHIAFNNPFAEVAALVPQAMLPNTAGFVSIAISYVGLATIVRLTTLRLEWLGWKARSITDIHVLGYVAPTLGALYIALPLH
ncbi:MAG: hypothetical protein ACK5KM_11305, partial [Hyphomicrobiaceae bacterium]